MESPRFVRIRATGGTRDQRERVLAEAWSAGAAGGVEIAGPPPALDLYAAEPLAAAVARAAAEAAGGDVLLSTPEPVVQTDWSQAWRKGLTPLSVSERLRIRPSFPAPGSPPLPAFVGVDLVIEPGQAFGTGSHGSTRRALEWIDELARAGLLEGARVLDVGCGTGILALSALALGARWAVGCDLDRLAAVASRQAAVDNRLEGQLSVVIGSAGALRPERFDLVVANLLRRELLPVLDDVVASLRPGGHLVLSGLLACEEEEIQAALECRALRVEGSRWVRDERGDAWLGLLGRAAG